MKMFRNHYFFEYFECCIFAIYPCEASVECEGSRVTRIPRSPEKKNPKITPVLQAMPLTKKVNERHVT